MMTPLIEELRRFVAAHFEVPLDTVATDVTFTEMGFDSLDLADLLFKAEDHFKVTLDYKMATTPPTLADLAAHIARERGEPLADAA